MSTMKKTSVALMALTALTLLLPSHLLAQSAPTVRELIPASAPAGARVLVSGRGLADPAIIVAFGSLSASVLQRSDRFIEVSVPSAATSGNVRVSIGTALIRELPFTVSSDPRYIVSTLAGGKATHNDVFKHPNGVAVILPDGRVAVADEQHDQIKVVTPAGVVSVLAGSGKNGTKDGKGTAAELNDPGNLTYDAQRHVLYVSDTGNSNIRQVTLDGVVTTIAGTGKQGYRDGVGSVAQFRDPHGLTVGADGAIYVADTKNNRIRRVLPDGTVTTFAGSGAKGDKVNDGALLSATFNEPKGIVADGATLYVADTKNNTIRKIAGGQVTTVITFPRNGDDDDPDDGLDGDPLVLKRPSGIGIDEAGNLIVSDSENDFIRKIKLSTSPATMITIAGSGKNGEVDGDGAIAQFKDPIGLSVAGAIYVADEDNDSVRRLCPEVKATGFFSPTGAVAPGTDVRLFGTGFVPGGTTVTVGSTVVADVTWISGSEISFKLPPAFTGGSVIVTVSSCGGTSQPTTFQADNTPPTLTITNGSAPLTTGSLFNVSVTPVITAVDETDPAPRVTATLNGLPFASGTTVTADGVYTLLAYAEDAAGNRSASQTVSFTIDTTPPVVEVLEHGVPFPVGALLNRPVEIDARITDLTPTTSQATIDGAPYVLRQPYVEQGTHAFSIKVTDAVGLETTAGPLSFTIDITGPALTITSHTEGQLVTSRDITIAGDSDDAVTVTVDGAAAVVDRTAKTYTMALTLLEGENTIAVAGVDAAGNPGSFTRKIVLDTRAPELIIQAALSCTKSDPLVLHGTVSDPHLDKVVVKLGDVATSATIDGNNWTATITLGAEGRKSILVEGSDTTGHRATAQTTVTFDRTAPTIDINESGAPFTASIVNRKVTLFVHATDADANTTIASTLDGAAWTSGSEVASEGSHTLSVTAKDCAGNELTRAITFTIDLTPPRFLTFSPPNGSKVIQIPADLTGTVDADAVEVRVLEKGFTTPVANGAFTLTEPGFADGVNEMTLEVADRAGNTGRTSYILGIKTSKPLVEILEGGAAMADGTLYTRPVLPEIRVFESNVTASATLDGTPFTSGTEVTAGGPHTIAATATDAAFGQSNAITRHFTIDRTGPRVAIVSPANGAAIDVDHTDVQVTAEDAVSVSVNGVAAAKQPDASWIAANVLLDFGETTLVAIGRDAAGNSGSTSVSVTRGGAGPALVLTFPPDNYVTNRPKLDVSGRVLRTGSTVAVTVPPAPAASVIPDAAGTFRLAGASLTEGEWTITATATESGKSTSVQARVTADFTPPAVRLLESGVVFEDGAGFGTRAVISGDATDKNAAIGSVLSIDGSTVASPVTITANGGHTAVLTARDAAGNESRLERSFTIGTTSAGGCRLEAFDPPDQSIIASQKVELVGRSGGAAGVKVNGVAAKMSNGSFCASVELPQEGPNTVTIACTDAGGAVLGDPSTITLVRVTNEPSVTITAPLEDFVTADATIDVTGTLGNGAVSVELNGKAVTINGSNWTATGVRLTDGINVLVARAKNNGGRSAIASRRITYIADPPAISISSPIPGFVSGLATTDISGTFSNVDPTSLAVTGFAAAVEPTPWSDTTGKFKARNVPLQSGDNTIVVTGRDRTGRLARAEVAVRYLATSPVVTITDPADGDYFAASQGETFRVSGTFGAGEGSTIDVNGVSATIDAAAKTFFADVTFSTLPGGMTPVVARLAQPSGGDGAFDSLRVFKLTDGPKVLETFPAANAFEVDPGVVVLALFSSPMDRQSTVAAFRLENAGGAPVNGKALLDKDVLTFAPATTLTPGERYTIRIATTAKDLAGQSLATALDSSFVAATSAPAQAPTITTASGSICTQLVDVTGTTLPGVRVRLDYGQIYFTTNASATGAFSYKVPLSGQAGYHVIRVRTVGADGTLSAAAELKLNLDCTGPRVLRASYDRNVNQLTIVFSTDIKAASLTTGAGGSIQLVLPDNRVVGGTISAGAANVTVVPAENLGPSTFTLRVTRDVEDTRGRKLEQEHVQLFALGEDEQLKPGEGFISGEVYDATTGRPLAGAAITIEVPTAAFSRRGGATSSSLTATTQAVSKTTDERGRYATALPEGAHTIRASASGYTTVWRQIIVPAGAGVIPIDIRLTRSGDTRSVGSGSLALVHGGTSAVTRRAELTIPAGAITSGASVSLTSTGAQSLAGLLPLGWSPLASAEIVSTASSLGASTLAFDVPEAGITAAAQTITAVRYDDVRDEWRVLVPVVNIAGGKASFAVGTPGAYALVYADRRPGLDAPAQASAGATLAGVADPCAGGTCPAMIAKSFPLSPDVVLPTGSTVATLNIDGSLAHVFPSGTAVQAYIDEELQLADGGRELPTPFATDLLLYRDLAGNDGVAAFNLAPSPRAAEVFLEVGFDHIRILPYPGRLDRGTLIGPEGGRVTADDKVAVEIPTGATQDALRATASSLADPNALGPIAGYTIAGGFQLTLERASDPVPADIDGDGVVDPVPGVELSKPARATFTVDASTLPAGTPQLILVELLEQTPFNNRIFRLVAEMTPIDGGRWTTKGIDRNVLPVDGVIREGRYLLLAANAPIAFAHGIVRFETGVAARDARVSTAGLGVADLSRVSGIFNLPVAATPAPPFTLVPRAVALGDGTTYTHASAPAAGAYVNIGDLTIVAQPPQVSSTIPANHATDVSLTTTVEAAITPGIDPSSIDAGSITVIDTESNTTVAGTVAANGALGVRWTLPPGETLKQGRRYLAAVASTVRGTNGTPLGQAYTFTFTTAATVTNAEVHPERIRITIPDVNGVSRIIGTAGALKAGWVALPVRRDHDFLTRYSAEAAADGSFSMTIGTNARDRISISDAIDLRVLNNNGALTAIIPLTPFVSDDGKSFIAPAKTAVSFTSVDGYGIEVPAGAFDKATRITLAPTSPTAFAGVPRLSQELIFAGTVDLQFEGRAHQPLQLTIPVTPGTDTSREAFLAVLGQSLRGPRLMAVDTLTLVDGKLTTKPQPVGVRNVRTNDVIRGNGPKDLLQMTIEAGQYCAAMMHPDRGTLAWAFMNTGATVAELVQDTLFSMYVGSRYIAESRGTIAFPVPANTRFVVTAYDPATSLTLFEETYNGIPVGAPGSGTAIASPDTDFNGPHPIFATPFRVETASAPPAGVTLKAIRDIELVLSDSGVLTVNGTGSFTADLKVTVLDVESGERRGPQSLPITLNDTKAGDRLVVAIDEKDVDPSATVSVVFNEPIDVGGAASDDDIDAFLRTVLKFERVDSTGSAGTDVIKNALLRLDSSGRRVTILLPSLLEAGVKFRLTLDKDIQDRSGNNLKLGQAGKKDPTTGNVVPIGPTPDSMELWFKTRGPKGTFAEFDIRQSASTQIGAVREISQYDNLLFVAAVDGGILAYDVSDPAALDESNTPKPVAVAPGGVTGYWTVYVDHHGRVFTTGMANMFGAIRTFRVEDFIKAGNTTTSTCSLTIPHAVCQQTGGAITSQNPGTAYGIGLPSAIVSDDRVEAIPRKAKFVIGDAPPIDLDWADFVSAFCGGSANDAGDGYHQKCNAQIPAGGSNYRIQRITIENLTLGLHWSEDAIDAQPAKMANVIAAPGDQIRITYNLTTYAVVSLLGYGIGVFDINAIESNEVPDTSPLGIPKAREQVALRANAEGTPMPSGPQYIGDLAFSPESHIFAAGGSAVKVYTLDTRKGVVEFYLAPPADIALSGKLILTGGVNARFEALKAKLIASGISSPVVRFNTGALYHNPNTNKDYLLIAALDYGLIVVEAGMVPLSDASFADAVSIKDAAWAVRVIDRTNMAAVVDGTGRVSLVDLSRVDERSVTAAGNLFPTVANALSTNTQDPRILWKSDTPIAIGNIAPVVDPDTGILIGADLLGKRVRLASVIDPKVRFTADVGDPRGPREIGTVVPLGIEPPAGVLQCDAAVDPACRASLGVFRVEARLPGSMTESAAGTLSIALESERLPGADAPQTPQPFPVAHLRFKKRDGNVDPRSTNDFVLKRTLDFAAAAVPELRYQKGWNRFATDWVVAVADVRAAKDYTWPSGADKDAVGCHGCDRPSYLSASGSTAKEIYIAGRFLAVRPELSTAGPYGFLAMDHRLETRVGTFMADLVRPSDGATDVDKLAAKDLPPSGTTEEHVVEVNTGEVATDAEDLSIRGRGLDFVLARYHSSAVASVGPWGRNFDSPLFARVRRLPNGDVEFYDGSGRRYRFAGGTTPPDGVFLSMTSDALGNVVVLYPDNTRLHFDAFGRLAKMTDRDMTRTDGSDGNEMHFVYDAAGNLSVVVDPTGRAVRFDYHTSSASGGFPGCVSTVTDFDGRAVSYSYDASGRLEHVEGPDPMSGSSATPSTTYAWGPAATSGGKSQLYSSGQIVSEKDGLSRVVWSIGYDTAYPWSAKTMIEGTGTWTFTLNPGDTTVVDPNGHSRQYNRDSTGRVAALIESGGATTSYGYDSAARLQSVTHPMGDKVTYGYGSAVANDRRSMANVTSIVEQPRAGSAEAVAGVTRQTTVGYGPANLPTSINGPNGTTTITRDSRGNLQTVVDPTGVSTAFVYDEHGLLKSVNDPRSGTATYSYVPDGTKRDYLASVTTTAGLTQYKVDTRGNLTQIVEPGGFGTTFNVNGLDQVEREATGSSVITRTYDAANNVATQSQLAGTTPAGVPIYSTVTYSVDALGLLRSRTDNGMVTLLGYDGAGNLTSFTRPGYAGVTYGYDTRDRLATTTEGTLTTLMGYDLNGALVSMTDARNRTTTLTPNAFNERGAVKDPLGIARITTNDGAGRPVETRVVKTAPNGDRLLLQWSTQEYDALGRVTKNVQKLFNAPLLIPPTGDPAGAIDITTRTIYDDVARKITTIDARGNQAVTDLDELGRVVRMTDPMGNKIETTYDVRGNKTAEARIDREVDGSTRTFTTTYEYDGENRLVSIIDPQGQTAAQYEYDVRGNRITETDGEGNVTRFEYDLNGQRTNRTDPEGGQTVYYYDASNRLEWIEDAKSHRTTFQYDAYGNLVEEKRVDGARWSFTYDENHNRKTVTDPNGTTVTFTYDDAARLLNKAIVRGSSVEGPASVTFTRDDLGRVTATETSEGVKTFVSYDSLDRDLLEESQIGGGVRRSVNKSYDAAGNVIGINYPSGLALVWTIDPVGRVRAIRENTQPAPIVSYGDAGSRLVTRSLLNGITSAWTYDSRSRLAGIEDRSATGLIRGLTYERTLTGNKLSALRADLSRRWSYAYNRNGWMTNEDVARVDTDPSVLMASTSYTFDPAMSFDTVTRLTQTPSTANTTTVAFVANDRNQYATVQGSSLTYDANGNLTRSAGVVLRYDYENRLAKAELSNGTIVENTYDANGRKVREKEVLASGTKTTTYVLDGDEVLEEYSDGVLAKRYVRGRGLDEIVRAEVGGTTVFPLQDELGNVDRLLDGSGATLERYEYSGYGELRVFDAASLERSASEFDWRWLFQGRELQPSLGLYDFRARTLSPSIGRFLQEDPAKSNEGVSAYEAFMANPQRFTDPTGLYEEDVHHYLTQYLAEAAGFDRFTALEIGTQTQALDMDFRDAMYGGANNANMERYHFVSPIRLNEMRRDAASAAQLDAAALRTIGEFLHAWEDSYSHQDDPNRRDFAKQYHDKLGTKDIGHGWHKHEPDWTWRHQGLAMTMAEQTHREIVTLCQKYRGKACTTTQFPAIRDRVFDFVKFEPKLFEDIMYTLSVPDVLDYSDKVHILDSSYVVDPAEIAKRQARYQEYLKREANRKREEQRRRDRLMMGR
jgi:RHS repeat-associated protein